MRSSWSGRRFPIWSEESKRLNSGSLRISPNTTDMFPRQGKDLDPTAPKGPVMSSGRLESVGRCPRLFFFQTGLGIEPAGRT